MKRKFAPALMREMFIVAIGVAAFLHSIWSFSTFLGGRQPDPFASWMELVHYIGWLLPGVLLAFAMDVGMIATSMELRTSKATSGKFAAFGLLAIITYTLQWLYSVHHMDMIPIGDGVPLYMRDFALNVSNFVTVWLLPGALPITAIAYTFSHSDATPEPRTKVTATRETTREILTVDRPMPTALPADVPTTERAIAVHSEPMQDAMHIAKCEHCGWSKPYATPRAATNALTAHHRACKVLQGVHS